MADARLIPTSYSHDNFRRGTFLDQTLGGRHNDIMGVGIESSQHKIKRYGVRKPGRSCRNIGYGLFKDATIGGIPDRKNEHLDHGLLQDATMGQINGCGDTTMGCGFVDDLKKKASEFRTKHIDGKDLATQANNKISEYKKKSLPDLINSIKSDFTGGDLKDGESVNGEAFGAQKGGSLKDYTDAKAKAENIEPERRYRHKWDDKDYDARKEIREHVKLGRKPKIENAFESHLKNEKNAIFQNNNQQNLASAPLNLAIAQGAPEPSATSPYDDPVNHSAPNQKPVDEYISSHTKNALSLSERKKKLRFKGLGVDKENAKRYKKLKKALDMC